MSNIGDTVFRRDKPGSEELHQMRLSDVLPRFARERIQRIGIVYQIVKPTGLFAEALSIRPRSGSDPGFPYPTKDYFGQQWVQTGRSALQLQGRAPRDPALPVQ